jgi:hypothetical protein
MSTILTLCRQIAPVLGDGWTAQPGDGDWYAYLVHADGLTLHCRFYRDRLTIAPDSVSAPDTLGRPALYFPDKPTVTLNPQRPPTALAGAIRSRLLPQALKWWDGAIAWRAKAEAEHAARLHRRDALLALPGAYASTHSAMIVHGPGWTCDPTSYIVHLSFRDLPIDDALTLLDAYYAALQQYDDPPWE